MTFQEYAQLKFTILTVLAGLGQHDLVKAEEWFQWVIKLPDNALVRYDAAALQQDQSRWGTS